MLSQFLVFMAQAMLYLGGLTRPLKHRDVHQDSYL